MQKLNKKDSIPIKGFKSKIRLLNRRLKELRGKTKYFRLAAVFNVKLPVIDEVWLANQIISTEDELDDVNKQLEKEEKRLSGWKS